MINFRRGRRSDSGGFMGLLVSLANFERLDPPKPEGMRRIFRDIFVNKRINLFVALDGRKHVGYGLYYFSYSSFEGRPTLFLEDIFVLDEYRKRGIGQRLFMMCVEEAVRKKCGRMAWAVLNWNRNAIDFYERMGAKRLDEWQYYRLSSSDLKRLAHRKE